MGILILKAVSAQPALYVNRNANRKVDFFPYLARQLEEPSKMPEYLH